MGILGHLRTYIRCTFQGHSFFFRDGALGIQQSGVFSFPVDETKGNLEQLEIVPFLPGILLSRKPPEIRGKRLFCEKNDG